MAVAKKPVSNVVDFDATRSKKRPAAKKWRAFGREWKVQQANIVYLVRYEEEPSIPNMFAFITAHIVKTDREDFVNAFTEEDTLDMNDVFDLMKSIESAAYPEIPSTPS